MSEDAEGRVPVERHGHAPDNEGPEAFLKEALVPTDAMRERLLSFMVHEIRNPLASAMWAVEMLERHSAGDARAERISKLSGRSVRRLRSLLEDFFTLERLPQTLETGRVELSEAVSRALGPHELESRGIDAPVSGSETGVVPLDPELVDKLLHTAIRRAARAGDGGPISVRVGRSGKRGEVVVERQGIDAAVLDPPMLTAEGSQGAGTVFGMFLARAVAQRLGVTLEVQATPAGSAIRLLFPLELAAP